MQSQSLRGAEKDMIHVEGAGSNEVNGLYVLIKQHRGKPLYKRLVGDSPVSKVGDVTGFGEQFLTQVAYGAWVITTLKGRSESAMYVNEQSATSEYPSQDGWTVISGKAKPPTTKVLSQAERMKEVIRRELSKPYYEWMEPDRNQVVGTVPWYFDMTKYDNRTQRVIKTQTITPYHLAIDQRDVELFRLLPTSLLKTNSAYTIVWNADGSPPDLVRPLYYACEQYIDMSGRGERKTELQKIVMGDALKSADPNSQERRNGVYMTTFQAIVRMCTIRTINPKHPMEIVMRIGDVMGRMRNLRGDISNGDAEDKYAKMLRSIDTLVESMGRTREEEARRKEEEKLRREEEEEQRRKEEAAAGQQEIDERRQQVTARQIRVLEEEKKTAVAWVEQRAAEKERAVYMLGVHGAGLEDVNGWYYDDGMTVSIYRKVGDKSTITLQHNPSSGTWTFANANEDEARIIYTSDPSAERHKPPTGEFGPRGGIGSGTVLGSKTGSGYPPPPTLLPVEKITPPVSSDDEMFDAISTEDSDEDSDEDEMLFDAVDD